MKLQKIMYDYVYVVIGGFLFAVGLNLFIVPLDLYSGGVIGMAEISVQCWRSMPIWTSVSWISPVLSTF